MDWRAAVRRWMGRVVCNRRVMRLVGVALTVVLATSVAPAAAKTSSADLWVVVHGQAGTADLPNCTGDGGYCRLRNVSWTEIYRYRAEIVGGQETVSCPADYTCGTRPWQAVASGTGSITDSRSASENCTNTISAPDGKTRVFFGVWSRMQLALDAQTLKLDTYSPMEAAGFVVNPQSCPVDGGYWAEGTGQMSVQFSAKQLAKGFGTSYSEPANSRGGGNVSWLGTITVINGGGPPALTPSPATPPAVRAWAREQWNTLVPIYRGVILANSASLLPLSTFEILSDLEIPITGLRSLDKQLREFLSGRAFVKLLLLPLMTDTYSTMLKTLTELEQAFNDPPLGNYRRVAAVPRAKAVRFQSCGVAPAGARPFCRRYVSAGTAWLAALNGTEGLSRALATDVGRESAAAKANDTAAVAHLQAAELAILPKLTAAEVKQRAAGKRLAGVLRSARFDPRATSAQVQTGIAKLLADLAKRGVSAADVSSILGGREISPKPLDLLSLISR